MAVSFCSARSRVSVQTPLSRESWEIGPIFLNQARTVAFVLAVAFAVGLYLFLTRSDLGKTMRAAADNPIAAAYMGIDVDRSHRFAFGLGVGITAIAGGLIASSQSFQPYIGFDFVIVMYAGVVLGGMGSILGAFWGGLTIGLVQQMSTLILPYQLQNTAIFVVFLLIIFFRPQGMFGRVWERDLMRRSGLAKQYLAIAAFAAVYLLIGWSRAQFLLSIDHDAGADLGDRRRLLERAERLQRHDLVRPRGVFRPRRLHDDHRFRAIRHHALDRHSARRRGRRARRHRHRAADVSSARSLFRAVNARLSARDALRVRMDGLPGSFAADEARSARALRPIQRSARLHGARARPPGRLHDRVPAC